jgi:protein gp37
MSGNTNIEWANATWSPWLGCTKVGPPCDYCYAEAWAKRAGYPELWNGARRRTTAAYWQQPIKWDRQAAAAGVRRRVFPSLCDPFDNQVPCEWRWDFWELIARTPNLDWLLLTKRPQNIAKMLPVMDSKVEGYRPWNEKWPWRNVWLGVSAGNQEEADRNIPILGATPAKLRFVSLEPLLGPINLTAIACPNGCRPPEYCSRCHPDGGEPTGTFDALGAGLLDLVIVGGETGPKARPMHPDWARKIRDDCVRASVPFFFKRWGEWAPAPWKLERLPSETVDDYKSRSEALAATHSFAPLEPWDHINLLSHKPWSIERAPQKPRDHEGMRRAGRVLDGRVLDGRTWDEMPDTEQRTPRQAESNPVGGFDASTTCLPHQNATTEITP